MDTQEMEKRFTSFVEEHRQMIYKCCYMYATDAENLSDLYQETVINLWKGFPRFRGECKPSTWVYRIALTTCLSFLRKSKSKPVIVPITVDLERGLSEEDTRTEQLRELYSMIEQLGKLERALILLWLEERSYQEIADVMGISLTNVATKLSRIREKLKRMSNN